MKRKRHAHTKQNNNNNNEKNKTKIYTCPRPIARWYIWVKYVTLLALSPDPRNNGVVVNA